VDENDIVTAVLNNPDAQDALRVIARIAIREVALRANTALPVEDLTVIGKMTIDRLRRTVTVKGQVRPIKPREFALLETLAQRPGIVFSRERCLTAIFAHPLEKFRACLPPEALEPSGCDAGVVDGVLGVAMAEVILD
jgi:DNA-binding response OmpR family regulator